MRQPDFPLKGQCPGDDAVEAQVGERARGDSNQKREQGRVKLESRNMASARALVLAQAPAAHWKLRSEQDA